MVYGRIKWEGLEMRLCQLSFLFLIILIKNIKIIALMINVTVQLMSQGRGDLLYCKCLPFNPSVELSFIQNSGG